MHGHAIPNTGEDAGAMEGRTGFVWRIAIVAALGGLLFGYDWVVIGGARQFYERFFHLTSAAQVGWANSCALVGCLFGSMIAGSLADRYGRRGVLLIAAVLFAISSGCTGLAHSFTTFIVWRIAGGAAIGLSSNVSPLYIAEVSPAAMRGRLVSLNQFAIVVGILLAQIVNWIIARPVEASLSPEAMFQSWNVQFGWRWMFIVIIVPSLVLTVAALFLPESPRWLLVREKKTEAQRVLDRIGGAEHAVSEIAAIESALALEAANVSSVRELLTPGVRRMLFVGVGLAILQQWSGINILFNYAGDVYRSAGFGANQIFLDIVITGAINLVFTVLSMGMVDRVGRRPMILLGCVGVGISHLLCALAYRFNWSAGIVLGLTLLAIACYAMTLAPVTWVLISEIYPNRVRSHGVSAAVSALWAASFLLTYTFPSLNKMLGTGGVFLAYGSICIFGFLLAAIFVPETRGRTLEQIESDMTFIRDSGH